jgi:hypothetical protein
VAINLVGKVHVSVIVVQLLVPVLRHAHGYGTEVLTRCVNSFAARQYMESCERHVRVFWKISGVYILSIGNSAQEMLRTQ